MYRSRTLVAVALFAATALTACTSSGSPAPNKTHSTASAPVVGPHPSNGNSSTAAGRPSAVTTFTKVSGTSTTLHFDAKFVRTLYSHGIATSATGKAKLVAVVGSSNAVLPITAGSASIYKSAARTRLRLQHDNGGLTVSSDAGAVRVSDFALALGSKPVMSSHLVVVSQGTVSRGQPLTLFTLQRTASFRTSVTHGVISVSGLRLYLAPAAAKNFDRALHTTVFAHAGKQLVGTITATIRGH